MSSDGERPLRVLLVDDDGKMVRLVDSILTDDGFHVSGFTAVADAMRRLDELDPDVVVLDEVMPDREGLEVADEIRLHRPAQAIVIFSSLFDARLSIETRRRGYVYCEKADGIDRLETSIHAAYTRAHAAPT